MYGNRTLEGLHDLVVLAHELKRKTTEEPVSDEYVTERLKDFLKETHEVYDFVFNVPYRDVPKYVNDERVEFFMKWRLTIGR